MDALQHGRRIAIVIGVNDTPNAADHLSALSAPEREATRVASVLMSPECCFTVHDDAAIVGKQADSLIIQDAIEQYTAALGVDDTLLVYFCGHGILVNSGTDAVLATYDVHVRRAMKNPTQYLSMRWLRQHLLENASIGKIVLVLDCCYAGTAGIDNGFMHTTLTIRCRRLPHHRRDGRFQRISLASVLNMGRTEHTRRKSAVAVRMAFVSTLPHMPANSKPDHTFFSEHFIQGLQGHACNETGYVTLGRLKDYINERMPPSQQCGVYGYDQSRDFGLAYYIGGKPITPRALGDHDAKRGRDTLQKLLYHHESATIFANRLQTFVGRELEMTEIRNRIAQVMPTGGYVTITAQAGEGKSSVIAKMVSQDGPDQTAFHFIALTPGREYQLSLLRPMVARLILKHGLSTTYFPDESYPAMRDYFHVVLRQLSEGGVQEVIYLDGLDQLEVDTGGTRDLSFLPNSPPPGIVFVLGTRPDDTLKPLEVMKPQHEYRLPHLSYPDFQQLLNNQGEIMVAAQRLYAALQGNAFYLALVVQELQVAPITDLESFIERISDNPENLFGLTIERLERQYPKRWEEILEPVLGLLLVVQEPLDRLVIRRLLRVGDLALRAGLAQLGGFIAQDGEGRYFLYHLKIRDYLQEDLGHPKKAFVISQDEIRIWHSRISEWCVGDSSDMERIWEDTTGIEQTRRLYARYHYITHLVGEQQWDRLWEVVDKGVYGKSKCQFDPSTRLYALDLDRLRDAALKNNEPIRLWKSSLLRLRLTSHVDSWSTSLFLALVYLGRMSETLSYIEMISRLDKKIDILLDVARIVSKNDANAIYGRVKNIIYTIDNTDEKLMMICKLTKELIYRKNDMYQDFIPEIKDNIELSSGSTKEHNKFLRKAVEILAEIQEIEKAMSVSAMISDKNQRSTAMRSIVKVLLVSERIDEARSIADLIEEKQEKIVLLYEMANYLIRKKHPYTDEVVQELQGLVDSTQESEQRSIAYRKMVVILANYGKYDKAWKAIDEIKDIKNKDSAMTSLAAIFASIQQWDEAERTARMIFDIGYRVVSLCNLAKQIIHTDQSKADLIFTEAHKLVESIPDMKVRDIALERLINVMTDAQQWDRAYVAATLIKENKRKSGALAKIAKHSASKNYHYAISIFEESKSIVQNDVDDGKLEILYILMDILLEDQKYNDVRDIARDFSENDHMFYAVKHMEIESFVKSNQWEMATEIANLIKNRIQRNIALRKLTDLLASNGEWSKSIFVIKMIDNTKDVDISYRILSERLIDKGYWKRAKKIINFINDSEQKSLALLYISRELISKDQWENAYSAAEEINIPMYYAIALCNLGQYTINVHHSISKEIFKKFNQVIENISDQRQNSIALRKSSELLIHAGNISLAKTLISDISVENEKDIANRELIKYLVDNNDLLNAEIELSKMKNILRKIEVLCYMEKKNNKCDLVFIERAKDITNEIKGRIALDNAWQIISGTFASLKIWKQSLEIVKKIKNPEIYSGSIQIIHEMFMIEDINDDFTREIIKIWREARNMNEIILFMPTIKPLMRRKIEMVYGVIEGIDWVNLNLKLIQRVD